MKTNLLKVYCTTKFRHLQLFIPSTLFLIRKSAIYVDRYLHRETIDFNLVKRIPIWKEWPLFRDTATIFTRSFPYVHTNCLQTLVTVVRVHACTYRPVYRNRKELCSRLFTRVSCKLLVHIFPSLNVVSTKVRMQPQMCVPIYVDKESCTDQRMRRVRDEKIECNWARP